MAALAVAAACCSSAGAIVGGASVPLSQHPYQVALLEHGQTPTGGQFCGGSIRDTLHIITAAHCVFDTSFTASGQPASPGQVDVLAGTGDLSVTTGSQRIGLAAISIDQAYDSASFEHDAALLTLASPLTLDSEEQPVELIDDNDWAATLPGTSFFVTGWGDTQSTPRFPDQLHGVAVKYIDDQSCENDLYGTTIEAASVQVCAADTGKDSCQGDSGGPLVRPFASTPADDRLVGIVSAGVGCANPQGPGLYTEVAENSIRNFLRQGQPVAAPTNRTAPALSGVAAVGQRLTCSRGTWTGSPSFSYEFVRSTPAGDVGIAASGSAADYTVSNADAGTALRCIVVATNPGGTSLAESARSAVVPGGTQLQPNTGLDRTAPVAKVIRTRCTATRCTLTVTVTDSGFSAGIKTVKATVKTTYRGTCRRKGRKVRCTKTKAGKTKVKKLAAKRFQVVASKLPVGKQVFTLFAVDKAGHTQRLATRKTVTTKRSKKR
jgi:hypothetical protein